MNVGGWSLLPRVWVDTEGYVSRSERRRRREAGETVGPRPREDAMLYHGEDVSHIDMTDMTEGEALRRGLRPCSICFPGRYNAVGFVTPPPLLDSPRSAPWVRR